MRRDCNSKEGGRLRARARGPPCKKMMRFFKLESVQQQTDSLCCTGAARGRRRVFGLRTARPGECLGSQRSRRLLLAAESEDQNTRPRVSSRTKDEYEEVTIRRHRGLVQHRGAEVQ